jgi:hypothetical protein
LALPGHAPIHGEQRSAQKVEERGHGVEGEEQGRCGEEAELGLTPGLGATSREGARRPWKARDRGGSRSAGGKKLREREEEKKDSGRIFLFC